MRFSCSPICHMTGVVHQRKVRREC